MITLHQLTKHYGQTVAVDRLEVTVAAGRVTGFLGPNGSGKSTTMRMILGLDRPTSGRALIDGRPYAELPEPLRAVGALLDAKALHPGRSARAHLLGLARFNGIGADRVDEVLGLVGLAEVAHRRAGTYSLGMGQRLGIAAALLGDPGVLLFDEPVNGLDTDGVRWVRELLRSLAAQGRTVLVSSHLMSEMQLTADHVVVIGRGRVLADASLDELLTTRGRTSVRLRTPDLQGLTTLRDRLLAGGHQAERPQPDLLVVPGGDAAQVGALAHDAGLLLHELSVHRPSLEQAYSEMTGDAVQYAALGA